MRHLLGLSYKKVRYDSSLRILVEVLLVLFRSWQRSILALWQTELEHALSTFRTTLSTTWIRRAIRIRSSEGLTPAVVHEIEEGWRDKEWEKKEERYHETAVKELNELTRRFNIIAPYHVSCKTCLFFSSLKVCHR